MQKYFWLRGAATALVLTIAAPALAGVQHYRATLDGVGGTAVTHSPATGRADIAVDSQTRRVNVRLQIRGLSLDDLLDRMVSAPIGPIHLHIYPARGADGGYVGGSLLALPLPYGPGYRAADGGFTVELNDYDFDAAMATMAAANEPVMTFDQFTAALNEGRIVVNIHTDRFGEGEIAGPVSRL